VRCGWFRKDILSVELRLFFQKNPGGVMKKLMILALLLISCFGVGSGVCAETIKIGLMGPMSGSWSSEGQQMKQVVELLAEELNGKGGLLGKKVELISEDDGSDPKPAVSAADRLVEQDVVAVIGTYGSSVTEAVQEIYNKAKIIQIANGSTSVPLTEKGFKYFFRTCPRDDEQGRAALSVITELGFKRVAILHDTTLFSERLAATTESYLKEKNIEIVFYEALTPGQKDYKSTLTKMKEAKPDVVFFTGYYPETGILLRQKKEMGWNVQFIGSDASVNVDVLEIAGKEAAEGFHFLSLPLLKNLPAPEAKKFLSDYEQKYGGPLTSIYALLAGDGFRVITAAIAATKSTDPDKLSDYLHKELKDFPGFTGVISFDEKGDRLDQVYVDYKVDEEGKAVLQF
jgi:branched-chain amino acid transport system substrate-binding protein